MVVHTLTCLLSQTVVGVFSSRAKLEVAQARFIDKVNEDFDPTTEDDAYRYTADDMEISEMELDKEPE